MGNAPRTRACMRLIRRDGHGSRILEPLQPPLFNSVVEGIPWLSCRCCGREQAEDVSELLKPQV